MKLKQFIFAFTAMLLCFTVSVNAQVAKVGNTEYATNDDAGTVTTELEVETLAELKDALASTANVPVIITTQIVIPEGETVELDLNGKTVNSVFNGTSTTNHIYALSNKGTLTIKGNGSINSRGIYNYGSLTLNAGAINAIDGNGGYAVNNQSGSTFVMNGGVVAATNEDDHQSSSGGYDATALKVPAGCTATLIGGTINNVCDFTYAIDAAGTLNIPATSTITVNGTHGAIAVSGGVTTIDAGTFQIPADNYSRTDNVLYVSGGSLVVNGGTFIGDSDTASGGTCIYDAAGKAVVNGGTFKGSSGGDVWGTTGTTIKGGTFENLTEKQHIADGYEMNENGEVVEAVKEVKVATLAELQAALADNSNELPIIITETIVIPEGETVVLDLNGKTVTRQDEANQYALRNLGDLTIKDTKGNGSINARGIYNGYGNGAANVATAKIIVLSGTINAKGTNGGAAIFNYGVADIQGGNFTSIGGYSLNSQSGASMTIADGVTANNGIYASGTTLVVNGGEINGNRSGCHVLYAWNSAVTINGGTFYNYNSGNSTTMAAGTTELTINGGTFGIKDGRVPGNENTWTSCLTDTQNSATMTVNGGTFNGGFRVQAGTTMTIAGGEFNDCYGSGYNIYGTAIVKGGTFTDDAAKKFAKNNIAAGYELGENGTVKEVTPAAVIGTQKFATLQAAIEAVKEGETITLVDDVNVTTPAYGQNALNHAKAVSFTLDLNGKTLSANTGNSVFRFNIANSGATSNVTLTIKNGKIVAGSDTWCAVMASGISADVKAIMNLENLTIESSKAGDLAVKAWGNATINAKEVTVNTTNAAGGFYAVGGEIILDDCTVNQKGLHTAPYLSMAFAVSTNGKMTVNSGTYSAEPTAASEGYNQGSTHGSWVGGVMNSGGELIINGGTFSNGNFGDDALATAARGLIFADTNGKVTVSGGTFNALKSIFDFQNNLGGTSPVITVMGGSYSADPTKVTSYGSIVLAENYVAVDNNGVWNVAKAAAKIGKQGYATLEEAFKAAKAGDTVTILAGTYPVPAMKAGITVVGEGEVLLEGTLSGTLENLTLKNLHIKGGNAQRWAYGKGDLVFENVTFEATSVYALHFDGIAAGTNLTYKNCTIIGWAAMGGSPASCVFDGCTIKGNGTYGVIRTYFDTTIKGCTFDVANVSTTDIYEDGIHAVDGAKVVVEKCKNVNGDMKDIVNVHGTSVVTIDGKEIKNAAKAGNKYYATFEEAFAAVQAGETLTLLADLNLKEILTINKAITFDGNGKKLTSTAGRAINVSGADGVTIKNLTINASGERAINVIQNATNVTVDNVTAAAANYTVNVAASAPNAKVAISGSTLNGLCTVNVSAAGAKVTVDNSTVNCNDNNTTSGESYAALSLNKEAVGGSIVATNTTVNVTEGSDSMKGRNGAEDGTVTINGSTEGVAVMVAAITYPNSDNYHAFATLKAAIEFAKTGDVVTLIQDVTMDYNARDAYATQAQNVVINGNGKTLTLNQKNSDWASFGLANNSKLVLNNMIIEKTGYGDTSGAWNTHAIIFSCPVEMSNVTVNNSIAVQAGATLNNVTINEANAYYGLWINGNSQAVTINGGAINATNGGRGIKIADQYIDAPEQVTLNVTGTKFNTAKKAAVLVSSKAGANITASNVDITNVAEDSENFVWVDEDWAQYFDQVEVNGATVSVEGAGSFAAAAITEKGAVKAYYKTLAEAIAASTPETGWGGEVTLLKDVTLEGGYADAGEGLRIEKSVTINGAGYTIDCGTFKKGIRIYQNGDQASNVMFKHVNIVNNNNQGRCIDTRSGKINLMLNGGVNLTAHGTNSQPLTIGGSEAMTKVTISGGTIDAGTSGYAVISFVPVTNHINVQGNAVIKGLAAFYLKEGVTKTAIKLSQSTSIGTNKYVAASGNFGAIVIDGSDNAVRLENSKAVVKAVAADGAEMAAQAAFLFRGNNNTVGYYNATPQVITEGGQSYFVMANANVTGTKFVKNSVEMVPEAETRGYQFMTIEDAIRYTKNGETVKLLSDVTLDETYVNEKSLTLDLNGKTINVAYAEGSTTNHIYAIDNKGTLTIKDSKGNGTINTRGIFNYGTMTLENGTINAIDGNGGYAVRNYAGSFTMKGGTIATTLEDDNKVDKGGYDATPVRVDEGATFTMNGGVINNICDYTFAIDNYGTTTVNGGTVTSVHSTVSNYGTVTTNGGSFTCNGLEGVTAHVIVAWDGSITTINGGTFDGKDNYNGFNVNASKGANVVIKGGEFLDVHSGSLYGQGTITVSGGTFFDKIDDARCVVGFQAVANEYGTYTVKETGCRNAMTIVDGEVTEFVNEKDIKVGTLTYTRTFGSKYQGVWMALYVPFEIPVSELTDMGYEVAYFNDFRETLNADGEIIEGKSVIEMVKIKRGTLKANYPYAIKAPKMEDGTSVTLELVLDNVTLYSTTGERETVECSSATKRFTFSGTYKKGTKSDIVGSNDIPFYALYETGMSAMGETAKLGAFRVYMTITMKNGEPYIADNSGQAAHARAIPLRVIGEEDENGATIIYDVVEDNLNNNGDDFIYDLQGRRVSEPKKGGIYIKNGKKILY